MNRRPSVDKWDVLRCRGAETSFSGHLPRCQITKRGKRAQNVGTPLLLSPPMFVGIASVGPTLIQHQTLKKVSPTTHYSLKRNEQKQTGLGTQQQKGKGDTVHWVQIPILRYKKIKEFKNTHAPIELLITEKEKEEKNRKRKKRRYIRIPRPSQGPIDPFRKGHIEGLEI